jgi:hypothetical protein
MVNSGESGGATGRRIAAGEGPIIVGTFRRGVIGVVAAALGVGFVAAEFYRRYHTIPHIQRRTEYYRRLGIEFKPIVD